MALIMKCYINGGDDMGMFGGGGNSGAQNESNALVDQQFREHQADIEQKRRSLYQERLDIVKSQGTQNWAPDKR